LISPLLQLVTVSIKRQRKHLCRQKKQSSLRQTADTGIFILSLNLLAEDVLEGNGISREFRDALAELLDGHLVLVEVESELGLVVDVGLLLEVEVGGVAGVEFLGNRVLRVVELLEQVGLNKTLVYAFKDD
jgi:hypothetical protein